MDLKNIICPPSFTYITGIMRVVSCECDGDTSQSWFQHCNVLVWSTSPKTTGAMSDGQPNLAPFSTRASDICMEMEAWKKEVGGSIREGRIEQVEKVEE